MYTSPSSPTSTASTSMFSSITGLFDYYTSHDEPELKEFKARPRQHGVSQDQLLNQTMLEQQRVAAQIYQKERQEAMAVLPDVNKIVHNVAAVVHHHEPEPQLKEFGAKSQPQQAIGHHQPTQNQILEETMQRRQRDAALIADGKFHGENTAGMKNVPANATPSMESYNLEPRRVSIELM